MSFFNRLSSRDQILVVVGVNALLIVVVFLLVLLPQLSHLSDLTQQQQTQSQNLEDAKLNLQRLKSIETESAQTEAKLIKLTRRIPQDAEVPSLLVELQDVANSAGLDFSSAKLDSVVDKNGFSEIPFTVQATGTFYSLVDYMYRIENMARKVVVTGITVTGGQGYPVLKLEIKAKAFKLSKSASPILPPPPGVPGTPGGPAPASGQTPTAPAAPPAPAP